MKTAKNFLCKVFVFCLVLHSIRVFASPPGFIPPRQFPPRFEKCSLGLTGRRLSQTGAQTEVSAENVHDLRALVDDAEPGAEFSFVEDVQLPQTITVRTENLTFHGVRGARPAITCADGQGGVAVNANYVRFQNVIFKDCAQAAVRVEALPCEEPLGQECSARSLEVSFQNVDFVNNGIGGAMEGGGLRIGELVRAEVRNCRFEGNQATDGAAIAFGGTDLLVQNCEFVNNRAVVSGGAIAASHSAATIRRLTITKSRFELNACKTGPGDHDDPTLARFKGLENSRYVNFPLPYRAGGALYASGFTDIQISNCAFRDNHAVPSGGALYLINNAKAVIEDCVFEGNYVQPADSSPDALDMELGGAIFAAFSEETSTLELVNSKFDNNTAVYGGAVHFVAHIEAHLNGRDCEFTRNRAKLGGGAMVLRNAISSLLLDASFANNSAFVGGAIFLTNGGGLSMQETRRHRVISRFEDNVACDGGAVFGIGGGTLLLDEVAFARNRAGRNGGAVCLFDSKAGSEVVIQEAWMSENAAQRGGALYFDSVSAVRMTGGAPDPNDIFFFGGTGRHDSEFINNTAIAGGAIFYKASNLVDNSFVIDNGVFLGNEAVDSLEGIIDEPLCYPRSDSNVHNLRFAGPVGGSAAPASALIDLSSAAPCEPGGGGAMCLVLSGISARAPASVELTRCNFTENRANVAGAVLLSTENSIEWRDNCPQSEESTSTLLTSQPCRSLSLRAMRFEQNSARFAGGALLATNLTHVHYSTVDDDGAEFAFETLARHRDSAGFVGNTVGLGGYGPDVASAAVRLSFRSPTPDPVTGVLFVDHHGGPLNALPPIEIEVVDALGQVVTAGISDAELRIRAKSKLLGNNTTIAGGQVVSTAENGLALFDALTLTAPAGTYEIVFSVRGQKRVNTKGSVVLRECRLGERFSSVDGYTCESCASETFTLYHHSEKCEDCPIKAKCAGSASLIPRTGYWHSSPFSVILHECAHRDACSYEDRQGTLQQVHDDHAEAFLRRFRENDSPVFSNNEYPQCRPGYSGPLCGSCAEGYGHADGKSCVKCKDRGIVAAVILLLMLWQLLFLSIAIRSALVSIRDMSQMLKIAQQQPMGNTNGRAATSGHSSAPSPSPGPTSQPPSSGLTLQQRYTVQYTIAAQHVSETIKICVNVFQVTSTAVNINVEWTNSLKNMLSGMHSAVGFSSGATIMPVTCLLDSGDGDRFIHEVVLRMAFPVLLAIVVILFVGLQLQFRRIRKPQQQNFMSRVITCLLVITLFTYQSITESLMGTVSCIELDADELSKAEAYDVVSKDIDYSRFSTARGRYWSEDTSIECFGKSHAYLVSFLGIPGILLFVCGIPLYLLIFLLYKRHKGGLMDLDVINTYGFIYQNYEDKCVYWEVCILVRKALISAIVVFAYPLGANLQGVMSLGVLILALAIHLIAVPFKYLPLNVLEGCSLVVSILTFYAGVVFNDENTSESARVLLSIMLVAVNAMLFVAILVIVAVYGDKYVVAKLRYTGVTQIPRNPISRIILLAYVMQERMISKVSSSFGFRRKNAGPVNTGRGLMTQPPQPYVRQASIMGESKPML